MRLIRFLVLGRFLGTVLILAVLLFAGVAFAQVTPDDPGVAVSHILKALGDRSWLALTGGATFLVVYVLRRWGAKWVPWFATSRGGVALVAACGVLTVIGSAAWDGQITFREVVDGLGTMLLASGGWSLSKNAATPTPAPASPAG